MKYITPFNFEIVRYEFQIVHGEPKIVISQVKVLDENGKYVKFAKLEKVLPYLAECPVTFKRKEPKEAV